MGGVGGGVRTVTLPPIEQLATEMTDGQLCSTSVPPVADWYIFFYKDRQEGVVRKTERVVSNLSGGEMKGVCACGLGRVGGHKRQPYQIHLSSCTKAQD